MATTVKTGWLQDKNGDKFAPKTLISQVQTSDGVSLEDKIYGDIAETVRDYIKDVNIETDDTLSPDSANPIANKAVCVALDELTAEIDSKLEDKADFEHEHKDKYYTKEEVIEKINDHELKSEIHFTSDERTKLSGIELNAQKNTITGVKGDSESDYRIGNVNITKANIGLGKADNTSDVEKPVSTAQQAAIDAALNTAKEYTNDKTSGLASTSSVNTSISTHNTATDAHNDIRILINNLTTAVNNFLDVDDTTTDQLSEVLTLINNNKGTLESLTSNKINVSDIVNNLTTNSDSKVLSAAQGSTLKNLIDTLQTELDSHTHAISDVTGLQSALDGKAASSHGTHVSYSTTAPVMDGTASVGTASTVARSDHKHPTDTSRASQTSLDTHTSNTTVHITSTERSNWNAAKSHADSAHAPSNAEKNQNAFSNVKVGSTTIAADTTTDTLTLVAGTNVTLTPDANGDSVTISSTDTNTTYSAGTGISLSGTTFSNSGVRSVATGSSNGTISVNTNGTATNVAVKGLGSAAYTASTAYDAAGAANTALTNAKAYTDSVASGKAASSHTHNYAGSSSAGGAATSANKVNSSLTVKLNGGTTEGTNLFTFNGSAAKSINITPSTIGAAANSHTHDDRYYTESEVDTKLSGKANSSHGNHVPTTQTANNATFLRNDNTWQKVTPANIGAAASSHNHAASNITSGTLSSDRLPTVPISKGGTGATTAAAARTNLGAAPAYTYGTTDLTAGSSTLETGKLYFVYE